MLRYIFGNLLVLLESEKVIVFKDCPIFRDSGIAGKVMVDSFCPDKPGVGVAFFIEFEVRGRRDEADDHYWVGLIGGDKIKESVEAACKEVLIFNSYNEVREAGYWRL